MDGGGSFGRRGGGASGGRTDDRGGAGGSQVNPSPPPRAWGNKPPQQDQGQGSGTGGQRPAQQPLEVGVGPTPPRRAWTGSPWGPPTDASSPAKHQTQLRPQPKTQGPPQSSDVDIQSLKISEKQPISSHSESTENRTMPIKRPDCGGSLAIRTIPLLVNHFPVNFNLNATIIHYDVDVEAVASPGDRFVKKSVSKSDLHLIGEKLFYSRFPLLKIAYDGEKNIFSVVTLPTGEFKVELSDEEDSEIRSHLFTIKFVNELKLSKLKDYLMENLSYIPRDVLQGMNLVMKENPSKNRIHVGPSFYSANYEARDDLHYGLTAYRGFQQSLRPTSQGLTLCLNCSVLAFHKPLPVLEFLKERIREFNGINDVTKLRQQVIDALKGLKKCRLLKKLSVAPSHERKDTIYEMVRAKDGHCVDVMKNFEIGVDKNMTRVAGRVIGVPDLKLGSLSVCCLSTTVSKGQDKYFASLCLKINAKLGGSNVELSGRLPHFEGKEHVMFIGADVSHPGRRDCPSIAAVVGTVNWPAANRYAAKINSVKPSKIVVFRDGVGDNQFDMVLNEELIDLMRTIYSDDYKPPITLVVAQKGHRTRLFLENASDGDASSNVPPGTVVDTIVHPFNFDFYLCSHYGGLGTSKPTHYYVLWDENGFNFDLRSTDTDTPTRDF
ncbi:unnamed protein product [Fraxinus pennsylvanica]|uniref:Piwi domain-containing protein n=1 Tax=Fraxinus pennsylvanica TaxID=56036 RepID=A0AAD2AEB3_9LAMI|nr:unnamed protein product [Fraxinus pennsylvanica]